MKQFRNSTFFKVFLLLLLAGAFAARIVYVNTHSLNEKREFYAMGEWVPLAGDFIDSAKENTSGYYLRVDSAKLFSYTDYMQECGYDQSYITERIRLPVLELTVTLRNVENQDGFLALSRFDLLNQTRNLFDSYSPLYAGLKNPTLEDAVGVTIRPNTEFTVCLPFTMQYGAEDRSSLLEDGADDLYYFVISKYPTRKEIKIIPE